MPDFGLSTSIPVLAGCGDVMVELMAVGGGVLLSDGGAESDTLTSAAADLEWGKVAEVLAPNILEVTLLSDDVDADAKD